VTIVILIKSQSALLLILVMAVHFRIYEKVVDSIAAVGESSQAYIYTIQFYMDWYIATLYILTI